MTARTRKLIGLLGLLAFVIVYALVAMAVGAVGLEGAAGWQRTLYYIIAGTAWAVPLMPLIRWMQRPD